MGSDAVFVRALVADAINPSESDNLRLHLQGQYAFGSQRVQRNLVVAPGLPKLAGHERTKTQSKKCTLTRVSGMSQKELDDITQLWLVGTQAGEQGDEEARVFFQGTFGPWAAHVMRARRS